MLSFLGFAIFIFATGGSWAALPHGWKACKMGSPGYNDCMIKQINNAVQTLKGGSKILGVNPMDPLKILSMKLEQGTGPVSIKLDLSDIDITGVSSCVLKTFKGTEWKKFEGTVHCPSASLAGQYKIDGKVLTLPITGSGKSTVKLDDIVVNVVLEMKEVKKGGKKHFSMTRFLADVKPGKTSLYFENLFNGNKELGDTMNTFLNENGEQIFNELKPAVTRTLEQAFLQIADQVFSKIPADELNVK